MGRFRIYIDEVGNHHLESSKNPNERFFGLTGVIMPISYANRVAFPRLEELKDRFFESADSPVILHRKEIAQQKGPFDVLSDPATRRAFDRDLLHLLSDLDFTVLSVVIDKKEHLERYGTWAYHPYHYALAWILERYTFFLEEKDGNGDVLAEARGKSLDRELSAEFSRMFENGTQYVGANRISSRLTSKNLKLRPKVANIAGLQLADLIAHPSMVAMRTAKKTEPQAPNFSAKIEKILETSKYRRAPNGTIDGWGRKWMP